MSTCPWFISLEEEAPGKVRARVFLAGKHIRNVVGSPLFVAMATRLVLLRALDFSAAFDMFIETIAEETRGVSRVGRAHRRPVKRKLRFLKGGAS